MSPATRLVSLWLLAALAGRFVADASSQARAGQGSCMTRWLRRYSPSTHHGEAQRLAQVFLKIRPPIDERNARSQDLLPLTYFLGNMSNAENFVDCITRKTDRCKSRPACSNGGQCVHQDVLSVDEYMCDCPVATTGRFCETVLNACASSPCKNGATCHEGDGTTYSCECRTFFNGPNCESQWLKPEDYSAMVGTVRKLAFELARQRNNNNNNNSVIEHTSPSISSSSSSQMNSINTFLRRMEARFVSLFNGRIAIIERNQASALSRLQGQINSKLAQLKSTLTAEINRKIGTGQSGQEEEQQQQQSDQDENQPTPQEPENGRDGIPPGSSADQRLFNLLQRRSQPWKECVRRGQDNAMRSSGPFIYQVTPGKQILASCNMTVDGGGWMVVQRRSNGQVHFHNRTWQEYKHGFGSVTGEFWIGNHNLHLITNSRPGSFFEMRIDAVHVDFPEEHMFIEFDRVRVASEADRYSLSASRHTASLGTLAKNMFLRFTGAASAGFTVHPDCGGWWMRSCADRYTGNANGVYPDGQSSSIPKSLRVVSRSVRRFYASRSPKFTFSEVKIRRSSA
eukprot:scpid80395/ scgid12279/ Ryncolin-4